MDRKKSVSKGHIRNQMKVLLTERDMTVKEFAEAAGLHYTTAQRFCSGKQENISRTIAAIACETLGVQMGEIFVYVPPR